MSRPEPESRNGEDLDPLLIAILHELCGDAQQGATPESGLSLARLAKRVGVRQSTLRRHLTALEGAGIVTVALGEDGGGTVALAYSGQTLGNP